MWNNGLKWEKNSFHSQRFASQLVGRVLRMQRVEKADINM